MPQARTEIDRDTKVDEILAAAESRLIAGGYEAMSVAAISRDLGIAQNSIYWYFRSKDDLFLAVLQRLLARLATKKPPQDRGISTQVLWAADRMYELAPVRAELRRRAAHSGKVGAFQAEVDALIRRLLVQGIEPHVATHELDLAASTFLATVEGVLNMELPRRRRHQLIEFAFYRMITRKRP